MQLKNSKVNIFLIILIIAWVGFSSYFGYLWLFEGKIEPEKLLQQNQELTEYDVLVFSKATPQTIIFIEAIAERETVTGTAYYFEDSGKDAKTPTGEWRTKTIKKENFHITDTNDKLQLYSDIKANFTVGGRKINISATELPTPMVIKARQNFTKLGGISQIKEGRLAIDGKSEEAYVVLLKGKNEEYENIGMETLSIDTKWLVYTDTIGNLYHMDQTHVDNESDSYKSHNFFGMVTQNKNVGVVQYSPNFAVSESQNKVNIQFSKDGNANTMYLTLGPGIPRNNYSTIYVTRGLGGGIGVYLTLNSQQQNIE